MKSQSVLSWVKRSFSGRVTGSLSIALVLGWMLISVGTTSAQTPSLDSDTQLPEITVTATRTPESVYDVPQSMTIVDSDALEKNQVRGMGDMVEQVPGVTVDNGAPRRLAESLNIRGFTQEQVILRKDGARVAQFRSGHKGNLFFDMGTVKSAEVLRGPSALYGSGGLGGIVSLETYDPVDYLDPGRNTGARINYSYSDAFGEHTGRAKVYGRSEGGGFSWLFGLTARDADDTVDLASNDPGDPESLDFAEAEVLNPHGKLIYEPDDTNRLEFSVDAYENEGRTLSNLDDVTSDSNAYVDRITEQRTVTLNYERNGSGWWDEGLEATLYRNNMELTDNRLDNGSEESGTQDYVEYETLGLDVQNTVERGRHELTYGLEHVVDEQSSNTTRDPGANAETFFPEAEQSKTGLFVQDDVSLMDGRLSLIPAVRYDEWENNPDSAALDTRTEDETSFQFGSVYDLTERWKLTANYAEGFRAPSIQGLYNDGLHFGFSVGPTTYSEFFVPNPELKPETSETKEFGLRYVTDHFKARANYYEVDAEDLIDQVLISEFSDASPFAPPFDETRERQAQNISRVELHGYEGSFDWSVTDQFSLKARYSSPHGKNRTNDQPLGSTPAENLVMLNEWESAGGNWNLGLASRSYAEQDNTPNGVAASGYTLFDAHAQWTPTRFTRLNLTVNNLTDNEYTNAASGRPGTGRDVRAGVTYTF